MGSPLVIELGNIACGQVDHCKNKGVGKAGDRGKKREAEPGGGGLLSYQLDQIQKSLPQRSRSVSPGGH